MKIPQSVLDHFHLRGDETGEIEVRCPYHPDRDPSASLNLEKGVLHCHVCGEGWNVKQIERRLKRRAEQAEHWPARDDGDGFEDEEEVPEEFLPDPEDALTAEAFLAARGFDPETFPVPVEERNGYVYFGDGEQGRNLGRVTKERPKYRTRPGRKTDVFWVRRSGDHQAPVWLTEGILDACSLLEMLPAADLAAGYGATPSEESLFGLRDRAVFVVFDTDFAGFKGARSTATALRRIGARPIVLEMPDHLGHDLNEALLKDPEGLRSWVRRVEAEYDTTDAPYVDRLFSPESTELAFYPTGIRRWDDLLHGGFRAGLHAIGAAPGVGKTALVTFLARRWARKRRRVLLNSLEIPRRQQWARIASLYSEHQWTDLEARPQLLEGAARKKVHWLARYLRVVHGWGLEKMVYAAPHYDVLIVDYLQLLPNVTGNDEQRVAVATAAKELARLASEREMVVILVSSVPRHAYNSISLSMFKESGDIEFVATSCTGLAREGQSRTMEAEVVKNRRGGMGSFNVACDLAKQRFKGVSLT